MFRHVRSFVCASLILVCAVAAQNTADNINLFQTYFQDATITTNINGEGFFQYSTYNVASTLDIAAQAAFPITPQIQFSGAWAFQNISFDQGDDQSGMRDIYLSGRYRVVQGNTPVAIGTVFTLPVGSEDIGEGNFNFGFFGSLRHDVESSPLTIGGTFGLDFVENRGDRNTSVLVAGSVIYPLPSGLGLVFEINMRPDDDYALLSGGLDYALASGGRVRGALGLGLDDAAPDFAIRLGYAAGF